MKHTEQVDQANAIAEEYREAMQRRIQDRNKPQQVQNPDGTWPHSECIECDDPIPTGRLELGKVRCVDCQEYEDKRNAR